MSNSTAIFIDNSNFYHTLKQSGRLPFPPTDYGKLFTRLSHQFGFLLKKIILYDAIKDISKEPVQYVSQQRFHLGIKKLSTHWPIEIKTRKLRYRSRNKIFIKEEKGIDVLLAVDSIKTALSKEIHNIIILSGDADFVPAVDFINSLNIQTVNLHLYKGSSTELRDACSKHILMLFKGAEILLK